MTLNMLEFGTEAAECNGKADQPLALAHLHQKTPQNKVEWKSNTEKNFRNSHGKIKFLENDKFSPFLVVM